MKTDYNNLQLKMTELQGDLSDAKEGMAVADMEFQKLENKMDVSARNKILIKLCCPMATSLQIAHWLISHSTPTLMFSSSEMLNCYLLKPN